MLSTLPFSSSIQKIFKKYIELDTSTSDGKNYPATIQLLQEFLNQVGFETKVLSIPVTVAKNENRQHLIARRNQSSDLPTLVIYNHIDVVPADYPGAFSFVVKDGKVFGRGTSDHKGSTVGVLAALEKLHKKPLRFNIIFIATTDEETNQIDQLRYLTPHLNLANETLVFDPDTLAGGVSIASLGLMQLEINIQGKSVHSGVSHLGINSVEQASQVIEYLKKNEKTRLEKQTSQFPSFPSTQIKQICSRCNINKINGGTANNVVPASCVITVDFRFIPEVSVADEVIGIVERLNQFCSKQDIKAEVKVVSTCESYFSQHPEAEKLNSVYQEITGEGGLYGVLGSTHAAQWCKEMKVPHFGIGVARGDTNMHGVNEFAYIKDIQNLEETLIKYLA
jgi:succinyl-diaminopimelate desuccinylase